MTSSTRHALIIGASRGLGLLLATELAGRGWRVVATSRGGASEGLSQAVERSDGLLSVEQVDMLDPASLASLRHALQHTQLDLLFVNGAINRSAGSIDEVTTDEFLDVMTTNTLGPLRVLDALGGLVPRGGTVAVMSSEQGSVSLNVEDGFEVYKASKAALNQLMRSFATRTANAGRTVLLVDPGHNRTDLGGPDAPLDPRESMTLVADVLVRTHGRGGLAFIDRHGAEVPW